MKDIEVNIMVRTAIAHGWIYRIQFINEKTGEEQEDSKIYGPYESEEECKKELDLHFKFIQEKLKNSGIGYMKKIEKNEMI